MLTDQKWTFVINFLLTNEGANRLTNSKPNIQTNNHLKGCMLCTEVQSLLDGGGNQLI